MTSDLRDKIIMVTGAGRGIGRATAERLAAEGAVVGIAELDPETAASTVDAIRRAGGIAHALVGDVGDRETFLALAGRLSEAAGRIDGVVNAAMWIKYDPIAAVGVDAVERMIAVGLKAPVWGTQAVLRHMDPARGGSVVNFSSPAADQGYPNTAIYAAVKGAIIALTRSLAVELGPQKVRVNAITPGAIPTPGARAVVDDAGYELRRNKTPLRRLGTPEEIAGIIAFLFSPAADFIHGEVLHVDGGVSVSAG